MDLRSPPENPDRKLFDSSPKKKRVASGSKNRTKSPNRPVEFKEGNNYANTAKIAMAGMH